MSESMYEEVYYFTLKEVLAESSLTPWGSNNWLTYFQTYYPNAPIYKGTTPEALKDYITNVMELVFGRYQKEYIISSSSESITTELKTAVCLKLLSVLINTYPKYAALVPINFNITNTLMSKVEAKSTGKVGFNDTPQVGDGSFEDDGHRSNVTESETTTSSDVNTPAERYREIKEKFDSIIFTWSNEFDRLFIEEGNI